MVYAPYIHEVRRIGDKVLKKYSVTHTDLIVYEAWEPSELMGPHATITSIDTQWYGRIGTRRPPPELERLPAGSEERFRAVGKWYEDQYEEAYRLIIQAFPEAKAGKHSMGEITLHWSRIGTLASSGSSKPWLPVPDPLGILERATEDAPVQLKDPLRTLIRGEETPHTTQASGGIPEELKDAVVVLEIVRRPGTYIGIMPTIFPGVYYTHEAPYRGLFLWGATGTYRPESIKYDIEHGFLRLVRGRLPE